MGVGFGEGGQDELLPSVSKVALNGFGLVKPFKVWTYALVASVRKASWRACQSKTASTRGARERTSTSPSPSGMRGSNVPPRAAGAVARSTRYLRSSRLTPALARRWALYRYNESKTFGDQLPDVRFDVVPASFHAFQVPINHAAMRIPFVAPLGSDGLFEQ